tara:strand:+ start:232 stop:858 length:627 start_codon:yes stop_codon:yes gene_type:complete
LRINTPKTKREGIIEAAGALFILHGYANVNMDQISKHACVSKQTIYSHFKSKKNLFTSAISNKCNELELAIEKISPDLDCQEYIIRVCEHLTSLLSDPDSIKIYRVCITEAKHSDIGELFWHAGPEKIRFHLIKYLEEQNKLGILAIDNIEDACTQLVSMINGQAQFQPLLNIQNHKSATDMKNYAASCGNVFYTAYAAKCAARVVVT